MDKAEITRKMEKTKDELSSLLDKAKKNGISDVEICAGYSIGADVSLEKNDLNNAASGEGFSFGVRVIENGAQGFATTNQFSNLWDAVLEAKTLAKAQGVSDPDLVLPEPRPLLEPIDSYDPSIDELGLPFLVDLAKETLEWKSSQFPKISLDSGSVSYGKGFDLLASSKGILCGELSASLSAYVMGMAIDGDDIGSFDSDGASSGSLKTFRPRWEKAKKDFSDNCMGALGARKIDSFKGYVILPPESVYSFFLGMFLGSLTASSIRKGKSKMANKLGSKVAVKELSMFADPYNKELFGSTSFDREGQPTQRLEILNDGILQNYFYNTYEAKKAGLPHSNGFASGGNTTLPGCSAKQVQIKPGSASKDSFFQLSDRAVYVNRVSGTSEGSSGDFSGVLKGGYVYEKGEKIPIKEVQIVGNVFSALNQIVGISKEGELLGESRWAPYMLLEGFAITGTMGDGNT